MGRGIKALVLTSLAAIAAPCAAVQITNRSFEQGNLIGWQTAGNASIQTGAIGSNPTHGDFQALLTTGLGGDQYPNFTFFGDVGFPHLNGPLVDNSSFNYPASTTIGSAMGQTVSLRAGDRLSFDFNFLTTEGSTFTDYSFFFVDSLDPSDPFQAIFLLSPWLYFCNDPPSIVCYDDRAPSPADMPLQISGVDLSALGLYGPNAYPTWESGWRSYSWQSMAEGDYAVYVGVAQQVDTLGPSGLLVDNFFVHPVPEPSSLALFTFGLAGLALGRSRKNTGL